MRFIFNKGFKKNHDPTSLIKLLLLIIPFSTNETRFRVSVLRRLND